MGEMHVKDDKCTQNFDQKTWHADYSEYLRMENNNIETGLRETGCMGLDWIHVFLNRVQWQNVP